MVMHEPFFFCILFYFPRYYRTIIIPPFGFLVLIVEVAAAADGRRQFSMEEEDDLLQFAIQQSLIDAGTEKEEVDIWEALKAQKPSRPATPNLVGEEERQLQRFVSLCRV
jgi:hypothetical protein